MPLELVALPAHVASISCGSSGSPHPHSLAMSLDGSLLSWASAASGGSSIPALASLCHIGDAMSTGACLRRSLAAGQQRETAGGEAAAVGGPAPTVQRHSLPPETAGACACLAFAASRLLLARQNGSILVVNLSKALQVQASTQWVVLFALRRGALHCIALQCIVSICHDPAKAMHRHIMTDGIPI